MNTNNKGKIPRMIVGGVLTTTVLMSTLTPTLDVFAADSKEKKATEEKVKDTKADTDKKPTIITNKAIQVQEAKLKELKKTKEDTEIQAALLDDKILELQEEQSKLANKKNKIEERIVDKTIEVGKQEEELSRLRISMDSLQKDLDSRDAEFKERAASMYNDQTSGVSDVISVVLSSDGFADLFNKLTSYKKIVQLDNQVIEEYIATIEELENKEQRTKEVVTEIESNLKELKNLSKDVEKTAKDKKEVETELAIKQGNLHSKIKTLKISSDDTEKEIEELVDEETLKQTLAKIEKQKVISARELAKVASKEIKLSDIKKKATQDAKRASTKESDNKGTNTVTKAETTTEAITGPTVEQSVSTINSSKKYVEDTDMNSYYSLIAKYSKKYDIPTALLKAVIQQESGFNAKAVGVNTNGTVDRGLMQLNSNTAPGLAAQLGWDYKVGIEFVPRKAIEMGAYYLSTLYVEGDIERTLTSYNRGSAGAKKYKATNGTYSTEYSRGVLGYMKVFIQEEELAKK